FALVAQSQDAKGHLLVAMGLEAEGKPGAEEEYRLAIKANGGNYPEAIERLMWCIARQLRFVDASNLLREYISETPNEDHTYDVKQISEFRRAAALKARIERDPLPRLSDLLEFIPIADGYGGVERGRSYASEAVHLYPDSVDALLALSRLSPADERIELLTKAVKLDPGDPRVHSGLGASYVTAGQISDALREYKEALRLTNGKEANAWLGIGFAYEINGETQNAINAFRQYLSGREISSEYDQQIESRIRHLEQRLSENK
ncbi:MAG: tetratricopeptide repeat protein, partial [Blastocatellia bacterium]